MANRTHNLFLPVALKRMASSFARKQSLFAVWTIIAALLIQQSAIARISISSARDGHSVESIPSEAGTVFIDSNSGTKMVRVTDSRDGQASLATRVDSSSFNLDSSRFFVNLEGVPTLYSFDPSSLTIHKQGFLFGSLPLQFDSCHWSSAETDTIFGLGPADSARIYAYDTRFGSNTLLKDFSGILPNGEARNLSKAWSDDNHFAFILRESGSAWRFGVVWDRTSDRIYLFDAADSASGVPAFNDAHLDRSGEALMVNGDVTRVWRYRTQQQSDAVQLESAGDPLAMKAMTQEDDAFDLFGSTRSRNFPANDVSRDGRFSIFPSHTNGSRSDMFIAAVNISATASSVTWTHMVNCTASANSLQKTGGIDQADDAHATSTQGVLAGDAYVEFTAQEADKERWCGLNNSNAIHGSSSDINFAIKLTSNKKANVVENGVVKAKIKYKAGNVLRVAVESDVVNYYKNGSVFYTSTASPTYPLLVNASLVDKMASVSSVMISLLNIGAVMSISPARASVASGTSSQFTALVTGSTDTITWSATGGSVTSTGLYTAPATPGTYTVRASCTSNPNVGASATVSVAQSSDTTPPVISGVNSSNVTGNGATIAWNTDEPSDTQIEYGPTSGYGAMSTRNPALVTSHSVAFGGLASALVYHYRVRSKDAGGNLAVSGDLTFTTPGTSDTTPPLITGVAASSITVNGTTIVWNTNEASNTQVDYGTTSSYGSSTSLNSSMATSHTATLSNLSASTSHHYRVRSRDAAGNLALSGDFTFTTAAVSGGGVIVKTDYGVYAPPPAPPLPAAGGTFVDPTFGTTIMRLTDASDGTFNVNSYSYWPCFNKDSTKLWVICKPGAMLYSFDPVNFLVSNKRLLFSNLPNGRTPDLNDATWSSSDNDVVFCHDDLKLYSYNVVSQTYTLVKDFASDLPPGELLQMSMSRDDNTFGFTVRNTAENTTGYIAWRRSQNSVYRVDTTQLDEVQVEKNGLYLVVKTGVSGSAGAVEVKIINLATRAVVDLTDGAPDYAPGHSDIGHGFVIGGDNWNNRLTYRNTATPHTIYSVFDFPDWSIGAHVSMLGDDEKWILMSTFLANNLPSTGVFRDELFQIATDGTKRVRRLAHLHSVYRDYWDQPRANISRDGRFAVFTSNWGATDRRDVFIVNIPSAGTGGSGGGGGQSMVISSLASSNVSASEATVTWNTNLASDTQVEYGTTTSYGLSTALNTSLVSSHGVALTGLASSTTYHYRAKSKDAQGIVVVSGDMTFITTGSGGGGGSARQSVTWASIVNCTASGGSLRKSAGNSDGTFDAGALSQQSIVSGDGYLEFTAGETNTSRFCGLARNPSVTEYVAIDFGFQLNASGVAEVRENFAYKAETRYVSGDVFRVGIEGGVIKYYKNGVLLYSSSRTPSYPLRADATFTNLGSTINNAAMAATSGGTLAFNHGSSSWIVASSKPDTSVDALITRSGGPISPSKMISWHEMISSGVDVWSDCEDRRRLFAGRGRNLTSPDRSS
jgi:hypothetical protein